MRQRIVRASASLALMAGALLSGCSESSSPAPTPTLALANTGATTATAARGSSATYAFTITRGGGFSAPVQLAAEGVPAGVTASFSPASLTGTTTASTMTLAVDAAAAPGTFSVTVRATGSGVTGQSAVVELVIPNPTIGLQGAATALTVVQGGSGTVSYTVTRGGGFAGAVSLAVEGLPSGVTAAFAPTSLAAGVTTSTLTLTAAAGTSAAVTNLTVRATGTGVTAQTAALALTVSEAPGIVLSNAGEALSVVAGQSGTRTIGIARRGGFAGAVTLALEGAPAGVTGTFAPAAPTTNESVLTLNAAATTAVGSYTLTVRGTGTGITAVTTTVTLVVTEAPGITLSISGGALSVAAGQSGTRTISIARRGAFAGAVTLALEGAPTGVTGTFAPAAPTANESVLTLNVAPTTAVGNYTLTVRGTGTGVAASTTTLALTVTEAPGITVIGTGGRTWNLPAGTSGTRTIGIERQGGYTGAVTLTLEGAPLGVTAAFAPAAPTTNESVITLTAAASTLPGLYTLTVRGTGIGVSPATGVIFLSVTTGPSLSVTWAVPSVSVVQGQATRAQMLIQRTGTFPDRGRLVIEGLREGLNVLFPVPLDSLTTVNTYIATIDVGPVLLPGTYQLIARATAGELSSTATLTVVVTAAASGFALSTPVTLRTIEQGDSASIPLNVTRYGGHSAAIAVGNFTLTCLATVGGCPSTTFGNLVSTAFVSPQTGNTGRVQPNLHADIPEGEYRFRMVATGSGGGPDTLHVPVRVVSATQARHSLSTITLPNAAGGETIDYTVRVHRTPGNSANVTFSVSSCQSGLTASLPTPGTTGNSLTLRISVSRTATPGSLYCTLVSSAPGQRSQNVNTWVNVTP